MDCYRDGVRIHYRVDGDGPRHVTLIHGVGSNLASWDHVVERLRDRFTVLRYDTRGHGESGKPPGPYSLDDYVADLRALLDHCGAPSTTLVGFSFGGMIAQAFAIAEPKRVEKLAILSAVAGRTPEQRAQVIKRADELERGGATRTVGAALDRWFTPEFREAHPEIVEQHAARVVQNDPVGYAAAYRVFAEGDLIDELHRIQQPTVIVTGENDPGSTAEMARMMHERIPNSELHILPRLRHSILVEGHEAVSDVLLRFI